MSREADAGGPSCQDVQRSPVHESGEPAGAMVRVRRARERISPSESCAVSTTDRTAEKAVASPSRSRWNWPVLLGGELGRDVDAALAEHRLHLGQRGRLLDPADEPGADVVAALVVEVAGALGGQEQAEAGGPGPLQQVLHRLLGRRLPRRGQVEVGLVEHERPPGAGLDGDRLVQRPISIRNCATQNWTSCVGPEELGADDAQPRLARASRARPSPSSASASSGSPRGRGSRPAVSRSVSRSWTSLSKSLRSSRPTALTRAGSFSCDEVDQLGRASPRRRAAIWLSRSIAWARIARRDWSLPVVL